MIQHILKIIWTERRVNLWIMLELILVFCILWFCTDYLSFMGKRYFEPKGFDIEHTYRITIGTKSEESENNDSENAVKADSDNKSAEQESLMTILERIEKYPLVESISLSRLCMPYAGSYHSTLFSVDTIQGASQIKRVSAGFFDVFKINFEYGNAFAKNNPTSERNIVISADRDNNFLDIPIHTVKEVGWEKDGGTTIYKVVGVANKVKRSEYQNYGNIVYNPIDMNELSLTYLEIAVRVKSDADKDFANKFTKEMEEQLDVNPYFLSSVESFERIRQEYLGWTGYDDGLKSVFSVSAFLIVNIFLGIIGTFWFRIQSRRSEIGLRIALGASKRKVQNMFVCETFLLLFLASIVAAAICINITMIDILKDMGIPTVTREEGEMGIGQYLVNYGITFLVLLVISVLAVWYPAKKASDVQPTEALRDE